MTIRKLLVHSTAAAVLGLAPFAARAGVVYDNLNDDPQLMDCSFNTTCAAGAGRGDEFAAQAFSVAGATTLTGGAWTEVDFAANASTSVNFAVYADGGSGIPVGPALYSGSAATSFITVGTSSVFGSPVTQVNFALPSLSLSAGNYFFAFQDVSSQFTNFLGQGIVQTGAAETQDGGLTWAPNYENSPGGAQLGGLSVALYSGAAAAPEPAAWALMLLGFGGLGAALRTRRRVAIA